MKLIVTLVCLLGLIYSATAKYCNCGNSHDYNQDTNKCEKYPQKNDDGFVQNCEHYQLYDNKWTCISCKTSFTYQNNICATTGLAGCIDFTEKTVQNQQPDVKQRFLEQVQYECKQCETSGWYLKSKACEENPKKGNNDYVKHCIQYEYKTNKTECVKCENKYYLDKDNQCKSNPNSPKGCLSFKQDGDDVVCTSCDFNKEYTLGKDNICVKFDETIKHCADVKYNGNIYGCVQCKKGYVTSPSREQCQKYPKQGENNYVKDCEIYGYTQTLTTTPVCLGCKSGMATSKDHKSCVKTEKKVENCQYYWTYNDNSQDCRRCKKNYLTDFSNDGKQFQSCYKCPKNPGSSQILQISFVALFLLVITIIV